MTRRETNGFQCGAAFLTMKGDGPRGSPGPPTFGRFASGGDGVLPDAFILYYRKEEKSKPAVSRWWASVFWARRCRKSGAGVLCNKVKCELDAQHPGKQTVVASARYDLFLEWTPSHSFGEIGQRLERMVLNPHRTIRRQMMTIEIKRRAIVGERAW